MKVMIILLATILIGCNGDEEGKATHITNTVITPKEEPEATYHEDTKWDYVEIHLDDLSFEDAFDIEHRAKGEGRTFWWRGSEYTTDLFKGRLSLVSGWVRNSDDKDDNCHSNEWDICGQCDGPGMLTWFRDLDGDGLGNPETRVLDCFNPSVDNE